MSVKIIIEHTKEVAKELKTKLNFMDSKLCLSTKTMCFLYQTKVTCHQ